MSTEAPDVDVCPGCGSNTVSVEQAFGLTFPPTVECSCGKCGIAWTRLDKGELPDER